MPAALRRCAMGSRPASTCDRTSAALVRARERPTLLAEPNPKSRRRPPFCTRTTHDPTPLAPTTRNKPSPSMWRPGLLRAAFTPVAVSLPILFPHIISHTVAWLLGYFNGCRQTLGNNFPQKISLFWETRSRQETGKWRSGRDSNPRYAFGVYSLSRRAPSTTRPPLRMLWNGRPCRGACRMGQACRAPLPASMASA